MNKEFKISRILFLFVVFIFVCSTLLFAEEKPAEISIVSLSVVKADRPDSFLSNVGTQIKLKIKTSQNLMKMDSTATKLISFTDDQNTDLIEKGLQWRQKQNYFTSRGENTVDVANAEIRGDTIYVPVSVTATPAGNSKNIHVKANLVFYCYPPDNAKKADTGILPFSDMQGSIEFLKYYLRLNASGSGSMGGPPLTFYKLDTDAVIYKIILYDAKQKELLVIDHPNPQEDIMIETAMLPKIKKIKIQYGEPVKLEVPVDIKSGIGI